ncbi:MAG: hypothetical protein ABIG96_03980 [Candidatus Micrarchaeota archaeon]
MADIMLAYEFMIIAAGIWLFMQLTFARGTIKEAMVMAMMGFVAVQLLQGQGMAFVAAILGIIAFLGLKIYDVDMLPGGATVLSLIVTVLLLFSFSG